MLALSGRRETQFSGYLEFESDRSISRGSLAIGAAVVCFVLAGSTYPGPSVGITSGPHQATLNYYSIELQ
jgi:hypothetical protein